MKFVDEVTITAKAGDGGDGACSFLREYCRPLGGPDGGDGGDGGSIYLQAISGLNTLVDFRHQRNFKAQSGENGRGRNCTGSKGEDLIIPVPVGTIVYHAPTMERLGELVVPDSLFLVAQGGRHGLGNARFKTSTNRAPRKTIPGTRGDERELFLELKILADVGLVGLPNAGKSTLIRAVSSATPKVADYPFTTLHPHLGVVSVSPLHSFVMADIPGLIAGAAGGAGLGIKFLRHLQRTKLLLHIIDALPTDGRDVITQCHEIEGELSEFDTALLEKTRWIVINKIDLLPDDAKAQLQQEVLAAFGKNHPVYFISAVSGVGCQSLMLDVMQALEHARSIDSDMKMAYDQLPKKGSAASEF